MDSTYPDPSLIGKAFVKQYYTQLHHDPSQMHRFYLDQSSMVHGGSEVGSAERVVGQKDIHAKILSMDLQQVHAKIKQVDSDLTLGDGITIQVTGELSTAGKPMRAFVQTFVLAPESPKKYYIRNDFFRYQDDDISEGEPSESAGEVETSGEQTEESMDTYGHHQQTASSAITTTTEGINEEPTLYGSPGANIMGGGDQGLQEDTSSWNQFPTDASRITEVQHNGLPTEEEAIADVAAPQATSIAPQTQPGSGTQPEMTAGGHIVQGEGGAPEPSETYNAMETQEPDSTSTKAGTWADRLSRGFGTSTAPKSIQPSMPVPQSVPTRQAAPPTTSLPQRGSGGGGGGGGGGGRGGGGGGGGGEGDQQRKRSERTPPVKDGPPPTRKMGGGLGRDVPDACQLFVGGLPTGTTESELRDLFSEFGQILEIRLNPKNFAFLVFSSQEPVQKILGERERIHLRNKSLNIEMKRSSASRGGGGLNRGKPGMTSGGGGGGGGGGEGRGGGGGGGARFRNPKPVKR